MVLAFISALACLAATTVMYTPKMRSFRYYRAMAFLFLFEGVWILADYAFSQMVPGNTFMSAIHYIGLILLIAYLLLSIFLSGKNKKAVRKVRTHGEKKE